MELKISRQHGRAEKVSIAKHPAVALRLQIPKRQDLAEPLLHLQRSHGNRYLQGLLGTVVQRKHACIDPGNDYRSESGQQKSGDVQRFLPGNPRGQRLEPEAQATISRRSEEHMGGMHTKSISSSISSGSPILQRAAKFVPGPVHEARNLAEQVAKGEVAGATLPVLNGAPLRNAPAAATMIHQPALDGSPQAAGFECWIRSVPTNVGSFDETVLKGGPWSTVTTKANAGARLDLQPCRAAGPGNTTLTARGSPSDEDVARANKTHEDHHAADHERIFNDVVVPWDNAMTDAHAHRRVYNGGDLIDCANTLFADMGGTPFEIGTRFVQTAFDVGDAFHRTPEGRTLSIFQGDADANCSAVTVHLR